MLPRCLPPSLDFVCLFYFGFTSLSTIFQSNPNGQVEGSIRLAVQEQITTEDYQDGHHGGLLGYRNKTILAILNFHVASMPPTKFWLNPTYHSEADVV